MMAMSSKIITNYILPPIPIRQFDWCAYFEDQDESSRCGYGRTKEEAIDDLLTNFPPPCPDCDGKGSIIGIECANCEGSGEQPKNDPLASWNAQ